MRLHRREFRVGQRTGERQQAGRDPRDQDPSRVADITGHYACLQEHARADHVADNDGNCGDQAEAADEGLPFVDLRVHIV